MTCERYASKRASGNKKGNRTNPIPLMVGSARFELAASSTRTRRATKLRYDPMEFRTRQTACPQNQMTVYSFETISQRRFTHACRAASATRRRRSVPIEEERGCGPDQEERCVPPWRVDKMESAHNGVGNSFYSGSAESRLVAVRFAFRRWTCGNPMTSVVGVVMVVPLAPTPSVTSESRPPGLWDGLRDVHRRACVWSAYVLRLVRTWSVRVFLVFPALCERSCRLRHIKSRLWHR